MSTPFEMIKEMKKRAQASLACIDALITTAPGNERFNNLLEIALQQQEIICIEMRRISEVIRPHKSKSPGIYAGNMPAVFGNMEITPNGWVHICLFSLPPHCRISGGTQYVTDSILRILREYEYRFGALPRYSKAFLGIIERCEKKCSDVFDQDNKGYKAVQNALKGILYDDDDQFELSLGLFTEISSENRCHIFVLPEKDVLEFMKMKISGI